MRFVHTSDWHLGRSLYGFSLIEDQAHILDQIVRVTVEARADALIVAGDVYDRAVPPAEAVRLLDDTIARVALEHGVPAVLIAGNHDSPDRLGFGSRLLAGCGVHVVGRLTAAVARLRFQDTHGPLDVVALPYAEPPVVREVTGDMELRDHDRAFSALVARERLTRVAGRRTVLVAHVFANGGTASESERPLTVGGSGAVDPLAFEGFNYVALGHLHRPQSVGRPEVRYSGSPLKYSLSEIDHGKSVAVVEIGGDGSCCIEDVALSPRRDVRRVSGTLAEILDRGVEGGSRDDYVFAVLTDRAPLLDALARVREVYPNCVELDRTAFLEEASAERSGRGDLRRLDERQLFNAFIQHVTGEPISDAEATVFGDIVDALARQEREVES